MKILVTGRHGQVAQSLAERLSGHELIFVERPEFNLDDFASVERAVRLQNPDLVISAAAYTQVELAECNQAHAMRINGEAPGVLARAAAKIGARIIHLSTDFVFDGSLDRPWREDDQTNPLNAYGESKLAGEGAVAGSRADYAIIRTSWVYSPFGSNFVGTMLRLAERQSIVSVVSDQVGSPTSAIDLADAIATLIEAWQLAPRDGANAIYHVAGPDAVSWADFAELIFDQSRARNGPVADVVRLASAKYPSNVVRPKNSVLDPSRFEKAFGYRTPQLRTSLNNTVTRILAMGGGSAITLQNPKHQRLDKD